jgi:hypothetical protein
MQRVCTSNGSYEVTVKLRTVITFKIRVLFTVFKRDGCEIRSVVKKEQNINQNTINHMGHIFTLLRHIKISNN